MPWLIQPLTRDIPSSVLSLRSLRPLSNRSVLPHVSCLAWRCLPSPAPSLCVVYPPPVLSVLPPPPPWLCSVYGLCRVRQLKEELDRAVPPHELLDTSANRSRAELASKGGLSQRHPPNLKRNTSNSSSGSMVRRGEGGGGVDQRHRAGSVLSVHLLFI